MSPPITYAPGLLNATSADDAFRSLWNELEWVRVGLTPRREYFVSKMGKPYSYGQPTFRRTYQPQPTHPVIDRLWADAESAAGCRFEVCFLNGYNDGKDQLNWHADDSPEMDDDRPIAIVSLGAEREIWFREVAASSDSRDAVYKLSLANGSLCLMDPGMQDTHQHRIPKSHLNVCGPRISLTFRGYVNPVDDFAKA